MLELLAFLALGDMERADRLWSERPADGNARKSRDGLLHVMAKRGDVRAVKWLLERGVNPDARWAHWDAEVTPLHLAALSGHADVVRALLARGADPRIRDSKHDSDAIGWAEHFGRSEIARLMTDTPSKR
jgi:ankyrin repeat protein